MQASVAIAPPPRAPLSPLDHGWTPPSGTLGSLVGAAESRVLALQPEMPRLERAAADARGAPSFSAALLGRTVAVIAEVKRRSPSKGAIAPMLDAGDQAALYAAGGASALSILTEPTAFGGAAEDLVTARRAVVVPLLRKDFIVDERQIIEARALGASAVLLIARALRPTRLLELAAFARDLDLEALVEVRDARELDVALASGAPVVGVNSRNLETLIIDPETTMQLLPQIPADRIAVAESGITGVHDVRRYAAIGADAVLVGSAVSAAADARAAVAALTGVARHARGG